jgi:hypothetical protein
VGKPNQLGWFGNVFSSSVDAFRWAEANPGAPWVVEIELPDPLHEWRVGDWYWLTTEPGWYQLAAPGPDGTFHVLHHIVPKERVTLIQNVRMGTSTSVVATPCDPPAWFTEDGER